MRIILGTEDYYPNIDGGAVAERRLAWGQSALGHKVAIIAPGTKGLVDYKEQDGPTVIYRPRALTFPLYKEYQFAVRPFPFVDGIVRRFKPDIIHIHNPYPIGYALVKSAKRHGIPLVGSNHLMPENFFMTIRKLYFLYRPLRRLGWKFLSRFYNRFDAVISPSKTAIRLLHEAGVRKPLYPFSNGVDVKRFRPGLDGSYLRRIYGIHPTNPVILYSGRLGGEKSLEVLIKAFAIVSRKVKASLVLSGSGPDAGVLKDLAGKLGISHITHFVGFVPDRDFPSLYGIASMFAIPSTAELQSIVTLEALASGLPVVAADSNALPELVHHGKNGFLHKPFDPPGMAVFIERLLRNRAMRKRMGAESLRIVARHDYPYVFKIFEELYRQVIESKKASARH